MERLGLRILDLALRRFRVYSRGFRENLKV